MSWRLIILFFVLVYALAWILEFVAIDRVGSLATSEAVNSVAPFLLLGMYVPTFVTAGFLFFKRSLCSSFLWKPTGATWPLLVVGALVPAIVAFGFVATATALGWGHSGWFNFSDAGVEVSGGPWLLGRGNQPWVLFAANVAVTAIAFSAVSALGTIGEEIGWRGFIQGHLIERVGPTRAILILGFLWCMWHLPIQLAGYNYPEYPVLGALVLSPVLLIAVSFFFAWLTLAARSFWPAAIAHGAFNSIEQGVTGNFILEVPRIYEDLTIMGISIVVGLVCWMAILGMGRREN